MEDLHSTNAVAMEYSKWVSMEIEAAARCPFSGPQRDMSALTVIVDIKHHLYVHQSPWLRINSVAIIMYLFIYLFIKTTTTQLGSLAA
jgi:hypothetical protein